MKIKQEIKRFTGGSLSETGLYVDDGFSFVRKKVNLKRNREYGFNRWYSQLKKTLRFHHLYPNVFPYVFRYGRDDGYAFFDMSFYEGMVDAHSFIVGTRDYGLIDQFFNVLVKQMEALYRNHFESKPGVIGLYLFEEVEKKLLDAQKNVSVKGFMEYDTVVFNGVEVPGFVSVLGEYEKVFKKYYKEDVESFTHGNITLENLLYDPGDGRLLFIDLYDENIIDSPLCEYSQLLQSSSSKYELYNKSGFDIVSNCVTCSVDEYPGLEYFNYKLVDYLRHRFTSDQIFCIRLFEISQFIRMLPFKACCDADKAIFFYCYASYLYYKLKESEGGLWKIDG